MTPLLDNSVHLYGVKAHLSGCVDALKDPFDPISAPVHLPEDLVVKAIEAHRHPLESGVLQGLRLLGQQVAVGGKGQVFDAVHAGEQANQVVDAASHQRLPSGQPYLGGPQTHEYTRQAGYLLKSEQVSPGEELVPFAVYLRRHTVWGSGKLHLSVTEIRRS